MLEFLFKSVSLAILVPVFMLISGCGGCVATLVGVSATSEHQTVVSEDGSIVSVSRGLWAEEDIVSKFKEGTLHSENGEPCVRSKYATIWAKDGMIHRDPNEGPAMIIANANGVNEHLYVVKNHVFKDKQTALDAMNGELKNYAGTLAMNGESKKLEDVLAGK